MSGVDIDIESMLAGSDSGGVPPLPSAGREVGFVVDEVAAFEAGYLLVDLGLIESRRVMDLKMGVLKAHILGSGGVLVVSDVAPSFQWTPGEVKKVGVRLLEAYGFPSEAGLLAGLKGKSLGDPLPVRLDDSVL